MRRLGCLIALVAIAALCGEVYLALVIAHRTDQPLGVIIAILITSALGWRILRVNIARLPLELIGGQPGRRLIAALAGALLLFPGFASDALGLILLLPFVQRALGGLSGRLLQSVMRQAMGGGLGGGLGGGALRGFPGGAFPGGAPGGFPLFPGMLPKGGSPLKPDEAATFGAPPLPPKGKRPGSYDTTAE